MTIREMTRLLLVGFGVVCALIALIIAMTLLCARTEQGVIRFQSMLVHGEPTNLPYADWGVVLWLESGDLSSQPKAGDSVTVLALGKTGLLKYGRSFWRAWTFAGGFAASGLSLVICGLYVLRPRPSPHEVGTAQDHA